VSFVIAWCPSEWVCQQFLQTTSPKQIVRIWSNFIRTFLALTCTKIVQRIVFHWELWLPWQPKGKKLLKIFFYWTITSRA
jgi:hypothetical protein